MTRARRLGPEFRRVGRHAARALELILPPACAGCGASVPPPIPLCGVCRAAVAEIPRPWCRRCGATALLGQDERGCAACAPWPAQLRKASSSTLFRDPGDRLVAGLKYRGWTALAPAMADFMVGAALRLHEKGPGRAREGRADPAEAGPGRRPRTPVLVPVPLAPDRLRRRGFNQAELLARALTERTGWGWADLLEKSRRVRRQAELGRKARMANVAGSIAWRAGARVPSAPVLLVDDVLTTGATAAACAEAVASAGGRCLGVVTFARTPPGPFLD